MNAYLDFLLSVVFDGSTLHPEHLTDLRKSGLTDETIATHRIRSVPPDMIDRLLGFQAPNVQHAYVIPFADPRGGWMDHVRMKIFPSLTTERGTIKYLQPQRSGVRIYFPLATLDVVLHSAEPLYVVEGEKKALAVAQTGLPTIGICGIEGWHLAGARALHPDFALIPLTGRVVELTPDGDVQTNTNVERGVLRLADALRVVGARPRLVRVPGDAGEKVGIDDYLMTLPAEAT